MLQSTASYISALLYHVWRAVRGRPQFAHLADSRTTLLAFLLIFGFSNFVLACVKAQGFYGLFIGLMIWLVNVVILTLSFGRFNKSKVLIGCIFAAMAGYDFLETFLLLAFDIPDIGYAASQASTAGTTGIGHLLNSTNPLQTIIDGNFSLYDGNAPSSNLAEAGLIDEDLLFVVVSVFRLISIALIVTYFNSMPAYIKKAGYQLDAE